MAEVTVKLAPVGCGNRCEAATSIEALNRTCYCLSLDEEALRRGLEADLGVRGLSSAMAETHPHLFASVPMFVSREHVERMARVIGAVEAVVATLAFPQRRAGMGSRHRALRSGFARRSAGIRLSPDRHRAATDRDQYESGRRAPQRGAWTCAPLLLRRRGRARDGADGSRRHRGSAVRGLHDGVAPAAPGRAR